MRWLPTLLLQLVCSANVPALEPGRFLSTASALPFAQVLPGSVLVGEEHLLQVFFTAGQTVASATVEVEAPPGFDFGSSCTAQELPENIYRNGETPSTVTIERFGVVEACVSLASPPRAQLALGRPVQQGTSYAFGISVRNPATQSSQEDQLLWMVRTRDASKLLVEESFGGAAWLDASPGDPGQMWGLSASALDAPTLRWGELLPFYITLNTAYVTVLPISVPSNMSTPMRLVAPLGWIWEPAVVASGFWQDAPFGSTAALPGAVPTVANDIFLEWNEPLNLVEQELYGFRVPVRVPQWPTTGTGFLLEVGNWNESVASGLRPLAVLLPGPSLSVVRAPWVDYVTGQVGQQQAVRAQLTTSTPIFAGGGFVFEGGAATRRLECSCLQMGDGFTCRVESLFSGEILIRVVTSRALLIGTYSFLFSCSNPANAYAAGTWKFGSYQDPDNYPNAAEADAPMEVPGFPVQEPLQHFERLPSEITTWSFDPRPLRESSTILAFTLPGTWTDSSRARLRGPEGTQLSLHCLAQVVVDLNLVFPLDASLASNYTQLPDLFSCEGRDHVARITWEAPLARNQTFAMRVVARNPEVNPIFNVWTLEVDGLSSAQVAASPVQTFSDVQITLASPSTRLGGTVGSSLSNGIRVIFKPFVSAEAFRVSAPMAYNFGYGTQCAGIRFTGQSAVQAEGTFTQALSTCNASSNVLEVTSQVDGGIIAGILYTLEADVLTPQQIPDPLEQFQLSSTLIGGGVGDDIFVTEPSLTRGLLYFEVLRLGSSTPRSGLTEEVQIKVAFSTAAKAGDRLRITLPPRFLLPSDDCPVTVVSPSVAPTAQCRCTGVLSCAITLEVLEATAALPNGTEPNTTITTWVETCSAMSDPSAMQSVWPCGSLLTLRLSAVYPQSVPVSFENTWLAEMFSVVDQSMPISAGVFQGWQFQTAMEAPQVLLGGGTTRAGAVGAVLFVSFLPANAAKKLVLTASRPTGWDFQAAEICGTVDQATTCTTGVASAATPQVLLMDGISIKAQILFKREIRNVKLADGGGLVEFELATFALGQTGNEVAADSSGPLASWRLPGALQVDGLEIGTYRSVVTDPGDLIFQQLAPRLLLRETVLILSFRVTQACLVGDVLSFEDPSGTFEMFQENATIKLVGDGLLLDFPSTAAAKPPSALEITVGDMIAPGSPYQLQLNARLRRQLEKPLGNEVSRKFFNFRTMRNETSALPINTNDGLIPTSLLTQDSWSSSSALLPFDMEEQVGAPVTQIQVAGDIRAADNVWLLAPVGVVIVSPCSPTPCDNITEDFGGTGRQAAALRPTSDRFGLRVELPVSWDSGRSDWVALVPAAGVLDGSGALMWASDKSVTLRTMPASVLYAAVALTQAVELAVSLSPGAAALAPLGRSSQSYVQVRAPAGYSIHCHQFRSFSLPASARVTCQAESQAQAVVIISNVDLTNANMLYFTFGLDTPAADPDPNVFSIALRDANNVTVDAAVTVPGMHIPQPRVRAHASILVIDFENVDRLQAWGEAAQQLGVLRSSLAAALSISETGVSVDSIEAVLGMVDVRRLQRGGAVTGQLQVNFSAFSPVVPLAELSDRIVAAGFTSGLQDQLGPQATAAGLVTLQVVGVSIPSTPVASQPPNVTTPTLRWSSSEANSSGTVSVNLIFQRSTDAIGAILIQMPVSYHHQLTAVSDMNIIQRGATSPFPLAQQKDGTSVQTRAANVVKVLLDPAATVAAGGYG